MHLAFVTSLVPDGKPTTGFEVANEAIVEGLRAIGCKVTVIGFRQPRQAHVDDDDTVVLQTLDVENAGATTLQKLRWLAGALSSGLPVGGSKLRVIAWSRLKSELSVLNDLDGLIINSVQMPSAFPQLLDFAPFIYVAHNVEHLSARQNAQTGKGRLNRALYQRDARLLEPIEQQLCRKARHVFCLSEDDRAYFDLSKERATTLQLLFPTGQTPTPKQKSRADISHDVGLIGTWTWQPNFVGLEWFLNEVVPLLDDAMTISIAGSLPHIEQPRHPGIKLLGRVADADEFVDQTAILALVSRSGTGVQLKTIEAFQSGMPCCATPSSVRGIANIPENCMVYDDAKEYAKALNKMVKMSKSGNLMRLDGGSFANAQRRSLHQGLRAGISSLGK